MALILASYGDIADPVQEHRMNPLEAYSDPSILTLGGPARVAKLMSLTSVERFDDVAMAQSISQGLPTTVVGSFAEAIGRARIVGPVVPEATLRRLTQKGLPLPRDHSERMYELGKVIDAVGCAYHGDIAKMDRFLDRPHPLLGGATPFDMARSSSAGADAVLNLVRRAVAGVAV
jgi:putative toxin-antitoxin system antitoxin component (TIGR02293 family)